MNIIINNFHALHSGRASNIIKNDWSKQLNNTSALE